MKQNTQPAEARSPKTTVEPGKAATEKATPEQTTVDVIAAAKSLTAEHEAEAKQLVESFVAFCDQIHNIGTGINHSVDSMLPVIEEVRGLISRKGDPKFKELRRLAKMPEGGKYTRIPEFNVFLRDLADEFGLSLRTLQRKLAVLRGEPFSAPASPERGEKASYTPPNRREFTPFVRLAEQVNVLLDEYAHEGGDVSTAMDSLKKLAIPNDRIGKALDSARKLETAEQAVAPVIASASAYIRALEDALHQSTPERLARVDAFKAEWRILRREAKLKPLYDAVDTLNRMAEPPAQSTAEVAPDPTTEMTAAAS